MKLRVIRWLLAFTTVLILAPALAANITITGAGATFPYPLYAKWAEAYYAKTGVRVNYQAMGSGAGIKQIEAKTVDFGATDKPLSSDELASSGLVQFPTVIGGITPVINLAGIKQGQLKLSGSLLAEIYLGKIKKWNDPAIVALNPGFTLPERGITVVHRSDASGTTFLFTHYLASVNNNWQKQVGDGTAVAWPTGIGGKSNEGVASYVQRINGAIGYVESAYASQNQLAYLQLQNKSGYFVEPTPASFKAAAVNVDWKRTLGFAEIMTNQSGKESWPITGATFILLPAKQNKPEQAKAVLQFFAWAYDEGKKMTSELDYIAMPDEVVQLIKESWKKYIKDTNNNPVWN